LARELLIILAKTRRIIHPEYTGMRRITTFRSTTDPIYDGDPIRL